MSPTGNLTKFEAPLGQEHLNVGHAMEGWAVCRNDGWNNTTDFDAGRDLSDDGDYLETSYSQPNGPNTFPLTIFHRLFGQLTLTQYISRDTARQEVSIKMVLKNVGTTTVSGLSVHRMIDVDADGDWNDDLFAQTKDSVTILDGGTPGHGVTLVAATRSMSHVVGVRPMAEMQQRGNEEACTQTTDVGSVSPGPGDYAAFVTYNLGSISRGSSRTVIFTYRTH